MTGGPPDDVDRLRARAAKCRAFAREYATAAGVSLDELAVELDGKADRLDRKRLMMLSAAGASACTPVAPRRVPQTFSA
jgi:hypothetical protein